MEVDTITAMTESPASLPWYKEGLKFKCTGCGQCCTGSPGFVWVTEEEMVEIANLLQLSLDQFKRTFVRQRDNRYALIEKKGDNNACIFLKNSKCQIYPARPSQCRTFPWWQENLNTRESWALAAESCEGISEAAPLVPYKEIEKALQSGRLQGESSNFAKQKQNDHNDQDEPKTAAGTITPSCAMRPCGQCSNQK